MRKYTGKELYELQQQHKISEYELAKLTGLSRSIVHGALYYYKKKHNLMSETANKPDTIVSERDGELTIRHTSRIQSLEELIDAFSIDRDRWKVKSFIAEKWDSATDATEKFLIRAVFEERKYSDVKPIQSVEINVLPDKNPPQNSDKKYNKTLALFDMHVGFSRNLRSGELTPFHDRKAIGAALEVATLSQPDAIVFGGDCLDMSEWSDKFTLEPGFYFTTQNALIELAWWLGKFIQRCPNTKMVMIGGNHEDRMRTLVTKRLIALMPLSRVDDLDTFAVSVESLLGLGKLGVEYIGDYPDGAYKVAKDTLVEHGSIARAKPGMTAAAVVEQRNLNVVFGHKHTLERASRNIETYKGRRIVTAACGGCLCKIDGSVPGSNKNVQWQNGFVEIIHDADKTHAINQTLIEDGSVVYHDKPVMYNEDVIAQAKTCIKNFCFR
jgi:metallophosphoesterase superfamily enzyme